LQRTVGPVNSRPRKPLKSRITRDGIGHENRPARTTPTMPHPHADLSQARYRIENVDSSYIVRDTMSGLVMAACKSETSAQKAARRLNSRYFYATLSFAASSNPPSVPVEHLLKVRADRGQRRKEKQRAKEERHALTKATLFLPRQKKKFWSHVEKTDWCWLWRGPCATRGYPQFSANDVHILAHRYAYIAMNGDIPKEIEIVRQCGERLCVNPDHMLSMTAEERRAIYRHERLFLPKKEKP
jgi:HNH endonuclease